MPRPGNNTDDSVTNQVDVLVVGGGTAGTIAAIQSARAGARTLIIERGPQLGGTATTGGVAFPGLFDAWGTQIIAGIGWELVKESVELDGGLPDESTSCRDQGGGAVALKALNARCFSLHFGG